MGNVADAVTPGRKALWRAARHGSAPRARLYFALGPAALFLSAGTWRWTMGWVFVALVLV